MRGTDLLVSASRAAPRQLATATVRIPLCGSHFGFASCSRRSSALAIPPTTVVLGSLCVSTWVRPATAHTASRSLLANPIMNVHMRPSAPRPVSAFAPFLRLQCVLRCRRFAAPTVLAPVGLRGVRLRSCVGRLLPLWWVGEHSGVDANYVARVEARLRPKLLWSVERHAGVLSAPSTRALVAIIAQSCFAAFGAGVRQ